MRKFILFLLISFCLVGKVWAVDYTADVNCTGAWTMDVDENPIDDVSANSNTGALKGTGEPDYATATPPAVYSIGYYTGDGSDDYVNLGTSDMFIEAKPMSIVAWIYPETLGGNSLGRIVMKRNSEATNTGISLSIAANYAVDFRVSGTTTLDHKTSTGRYPQNTWTHIAVSWDGTTEADNAPLYYNGVLETSYLIATDGNTLGNTAGQPTYLFNNVAGNRGWDGSEDEVAFFNDILTSTEINDIMDNGLVGGGAPPAAADTYFMDKIGRGIGIGFLRGGR